MKTNVSVDLNDVGRNVLACYIDGEPTKRLATRKDINNFLSACIDAALDTTIQTPTVSEGPRQKIPIQLEWESPGEVERQSEEDEIKRLQNAGFDDSYIRGWMQVWRNK
jgi:hypothetical protein